MIHIAILAAMPEEVGIFVNKFKLNNKKIFGDLTIYSGSWISSEGKKFKLSLAWSGWGKVSAARAATRIIDSKFKENNKVDFILFSGVAGAIKSDLKQWDIVIASGLIQHDFDARPLFDKFQIPALKKDILKPNINQFNAIKEGLIRSKNNKKLDEFGSINDGLIATGDQFISGVNQIKKLKKEIINISAVEMEGAAVAQVAEQELIPWIVIRVISDNADDSAPNNFIEFLDKYKKFSSKIIEEILEIIDKVF